MARSHQLWSSSGLTTPAGVTISLRVHDQITPAVVLSLSDHPSWGDHLTPGPLYWPPQPWSCIIQTTPAGVTPSPLKCDSITLADPDFTPSWGQLSPSFQQKSLIFSLFFATLALAFAFSRIYSIHTLSRFCAVSFITESFFPPHVRHPPHKYFYLQFWLSQ